MIKTNIECLRDPFILLDNGIYYAYSTGVTDGNWQDTAWTCYKNDSGSLDGEWKKLEGELCVQPAHAKTNRWAPEVHKHNDAYYMFTTYSSSLTGHRGCTILRSSSHEGPFIEITDGHITSPDIDAIDGTLYFDGEGQPWMIYVHEWTCTEDKIGRMAAANLSDDFTHFISEPIELFRADAPIWATRGVTDGPFMHKTEAGGLLMIWSNFASDGYCVGIAHSDNGRIDGRWIHEEHRLFSIETTGEYDGGHGMLFTDTDGRMYLCVHSPNLPNADRGERTVFIPVHEKKGTLVTEQY